MTKGKGWNGESERHSLAKNGVITKSLKQKMNVIKERQRIGQAILLDGIRYSDEEVDGWNAMDKAGTAWDWKSSSGGGIKVRRITKNGLYEVTVGLPYGNNFRTVYVGGFNDVDVAIRAGITEYVESTVK
jgi:hypothetical protein